MKHSAFYRYLLLLLFSFSISGTMFFYSMRVEASSFVSSVSLDNIVPVESSGSVSDKEAATAYYVNIYSNSATSKMTPIDFSSILDGFVEAPLYRVNLTSVCTVDVSESVYMTNFDIDCGIGGSVYNLNHFSYNVQNTSFTNTHTFDIFINSDIGSVIPYYYGNFNRGGNFQYLDVAVTCSIIVNSIEPLSSNDSNDYQSGYDAGYAAGSESGYGSGYSDGYASGEADGSQEGYNSGFQAGVDSVDTQSYYDAGYQAGYTAAYNSGYEDGYDEGYSAAMERIDHWGADTSDYPLLIQKKSYNRQLFSVSVYDSSPFEYVQKRVTDLDFNIDPNHTYKFVIDITDFDPFNSHCDNISRNFYFEVGGTEYLVSSGNIISNNYFYVPGYRMSDTVGLVYSAINVFLGDEYDVASNGCYLTYDFYIYDMGPTGDTQNHIANQTDQLTNGFDDDSGNSMNDSLSNGLDDFHDQENSLYTSVKSGLDDFEYFDFNSAPAMLTGISFVSSIMTGWFNAAGGVSGVGIVLSILFSIIIASMALGLYKWYQSRGK